MPPKDMGSLRRFMESDFAVPVLGGGGIGTGLYTLLVFVTGSPFRLTSYLGFLAIIILISYFVHRQMNRMGSGMGDLLFGTGRKVEDSYYAREVWKEHIAKAERAENYYEQASLLKGYLQSGLMEYPVTAAMKLAQLYEEKLIRPQDALYWYRKALTLSEEAGVHRAEAESAIERLRLAASTSDLDYRQREEKIAKALENSEFESAMEQAKELQRLYPKLSSPVFYLGVIASRLNNHALAAAHYREVLEREPDHERAAFNLAIAFQKAERDLEARDAWQRYLERFGQTESIHIETAKSALVELAQKLQSDLSTAVHEPE